MSTSPKRIQIRRGIKGWRKPEGVIYVNRSTQAQAALLCTGCVVWSDAMRSDNTNASAYGQALIGPERLAGQPHELKQRAPEKPVS